MTADRYSRALRRSQKALLVLAISTLPVAATGAANDVRPKGTVTIPADDARERVVAVSAPVPVKIRHVHLKPAPGVDTPATTLEFDMLNDSGDPVTDVVVEISIVEKSTNHEPPHIVAGPFTIKGEAVLEPGYTIKYQMIMRNLSSDCDCAANVGVLSARPVPGPDR